MSTEQERFTACWRECAPRVQGFAIRHVGHDEAGDVVAETFLVAWRRWPEVPDPPIAWLLVTARGVMANRQRAARRRLALADRVALLEMAAADGVESTTSRREALERLARLDEHHREALLLLAWDGLTGDQAAKVLGIRPDAFRRRVSRARAALEATSREGPSGRPPRARTHLSRLVPSEETP